MLNFIKSPHYIALLAAFVSLILFVINNKIGKKETNKIEGIKLFLLVFCIVYVCQRYMTNEGMTGGSLDIQDISFNSLDIDINDPGF
jgi:hypothetical protein